MGDCSAYSERGGTRAPREDVASEAQAIEAEDGGQKGVWIRTG